MTKGRCNCRRFEVYIGSLLIDHVYFEADMSAKEVRRSLIDHDGKPENISVYKNNERRTAFEDAARASHPEELA